MKTNQISEIKSLKQGAERDEIFKHHTSHCVCLLIVLFLSLSGFAQKPTVETEAGSLEVEVLAENLDHPWGIAFLPDNRLLVTERAGTLRIMNQNNKISEPLRGTPEVHAEDQGGMLDVALHPDFEQNQYVYLTYSEPGQPGPTTALGRGKLEGNALNDFEVIFRMEDRVEGSKHFGGRIVFTPEGQILLTLAERFKFDPAQDLSNHLGTIVRINPDGSVPQDNPFVERADAKDEIYSYGHRNIEAAAIDPATNLFWVAEMGPMGGDEFNQPKPGENYGWPEVSSGQNYDGTDIPDPETRADEFADSEIIWTPTISPSGMIFYQGNTFQEWQGDALIGGLTSTGLVRVDVNGEEAEEVERIPLGARIRDVAEGPDGSIYVITDQDNGKILRLSKIE